MKLVNTQDFDSCIRWFKSSRRSQNLGGLVERLNTPVLKTGKGINSVFRGFESHTLFHNKYGTIAQLVERQVEALRLR